MRIKDVKCSGVGGLSTEHDLPCFVTAVLTCRLVPVRVLVDMSGVDGGEGVVLLSSPQEREEGVERADLRVSFPPEVQAAIEAVLPSSDPLDQVAKILGRMLLLMDKKEITG